MFAEWLPHLLQLLLQLCLVSVTKLLATHLLGGGEAVKSLPEVKLVFFLKRLGSHIGQVATTHLREEKLLVGMFVALHALQMQHPLYLQYRPSNQARKNLKNLSDEKTPQTEEGSFIMQWMSHRIQKFTFMNSLSPCSCNTDLWLLPRLPGCWPRLSPGERKSYIH